MPLLDLVPSVNDITNQGVDDSRINHWERWFQNIRLLVNYGISPGEPVSTSGAATINLPQQIRSSLIRVISSAPGGEVMNVAPQIAPGFDGQEITIEGSDDTKTITFVNGSGLQLLGAASVTLKNGDILKLHYNKYRDLWIENYRSINHV